MKLLPGGSRPTLEAAFDARFAEIEDAWRAYLRAIARPALTWSVFRPQDGGRAPSGSRTVAIIAT